MERDPLGGRTHHQSVEPGEQPHRVSCPSTTACIAVGYDTDNGSGDQVTLAEAYAG